MPATQVRAGQVADGSLTDVDLASANKDGVAGTASLRTLGTGSQQAAAGNDARHLTNVEDVQRVFLSKLSVSGTFLLVSGTAYFVYLGRTVQQITPKFVEFHVSTLGAGAQTAEVGFFSTPNPPNKSAQSLTKLISSGTVDALTSTGMKRNTSAFNTAIAAGTHLWAGIRTAMATTQPTIVALIADMLQGHVQSTAGAAALSGAGPWTGAIIAINTASICPNLRGTLD